VGGIIPQDVKSILEAGAHGVAVSGSLTRCPDPKLVIEAMLQVIQQYKNLAHA
jgi:thiamine monophosphate synthase